MPRARDERQVEYDAGYRAPMRGDHTNPYQPDTISWNAWQQGHDDMEVRLRKRDEHMKIEGESNAKGQ